MEEKMAYIYGEYLVEFVKDKEQIIGEVFYPGEKIPVGKVTCHFYKYSDPEDKSHNKDDSLHIDILRVQTDHDKQGIGTFLMKKVIEYVDKLKIKHVTTTPSPTGRISMENLRRFYQKFKFGSGFLTKRIEFVDEDELLSEVLETDVKSESNENESITSAAGLLNSLPIGKQTADTSITGNNANKVGYLTVVRYLEDTLRSKNNILLVGASGAGVYALYLARKGHFVTVVEPDSVAAERLKVKANGVPRINIVNTSYDYLLEIETEAMDAVLCFGPLYSKLQMEQKQHILEEANRICKRGGAIFASFKNNEMVVIDNVLNLDPDYFSGPKFDPITMKAVNTNIRLLSFDEIEVLFKLSGIKYNKRFAMEGMSTLLKDKLEAMNEKQFGKWMDYHYSICEKQEMIGCSMHIIYVTKKN